jgi:hypothetical protein
MTLGARIRYRRIAAPALASLLAAFLCALTLAPPASATARDTYATHAAAAVHKQVHSTQRADAPDFLAAGTESRATPIWVASVSPVIETDSSLTVSSVRTRGPPAKAAR